MDTIEYGDHWGEIIDRGHSRLIEIRWFDSTRAMSSEDFRPWLTRFVSILERTGRVLALVDATSFRMDPALMDRSWRDKHIIPRYNAARVKRFAFLMPAAMPAIGEAPAVDGPAHFPTAYFGTRDDALTWLAKAD